MSDSAQPVTLSESISNQRGDWKLLLPPDLIYFQGHFPGMPVLPGVVSIQWAVQRLQKIYPQQVSVETLQRIKFMRVMAPELVVQLSITAHRGDHAWKFHYYNDQFDYASGIIRATPCSSPA